MNQVPLKILHTCQLSRFSRASPIFSLDLPVSQFEQQISWETPTAVPWPYSSISLFFKMSKRKIENNTRSSFSALIILSCSWLENIKQSNQIDIYLTSIVIGQKSTNQIAQYVVDSWRSFCTLLLTSGTSERPVDDFWRVCRKWHSYNAKISDRRLQIFVLWGLWIWS